MKYEAIQGQVARARVEQSAMVGEFIEEAFVKGWETTRRALAALRSTVEGSTDYLPRSQA